VYGLFRSEDPDVRVNRVKSSYVSDMLSGDKSELIVSKVMFRTDNAEKDFRAYTVFSGYPEFYRYMERKPPEERLFHEVCPTNHKQKPKFDIDISLEAWEKEFSHVMPFPELGEYVKDMVIRSAIKVMMAWGISLSLERDFCIFTSHGSRKRSYHIILSRYYHFNSRQAREFYNLCSEIHTGELDSLLFSRFVDWRVYSANASMRIVWCMKDPNKIEPRVKEYCPQFCYEGKEYKHLLTSEVIESDAMFNLQVLSHSLITFTEGRTCMPIFDVRGKGEDLSLKEISDETYQECKRLIEEWDVNGVYRVDGESDGKIHLERQKSSMCELCRKPDPHDSMDGFCYIEDATLFWHCGRYKGWGKKISELTTVLSSIQLSVSAYVESLARETGIKYVYRPGGGTKVLSREEEIVDDAPPAISSSSDSLLFDDDDVFEIVYHQTSNTATVETVEKVYERIPQLCTPPPSPPSVPIMVEITIEDQVDAEKKEPSKVILVTKGRVRDRTGVGSRPVIGPRRPAKKKEEDSGSGGRLSFAESARIESDCRILSSEEISLRSPLENKRRQAIFCM